MKFNDPEFLKLRNTWYRKLKEAGFEEIEIFSAKGEDPEPLMKGVSPGDLRRRLYKPETEEYYSLARAHCWGIEDPLSRMVWELHSEGKSVEKIFAVVKDHFRTNKNVVRKIVLSEKARMFQNVRDRANGEGE